MAKENFTINNTSIVSIELHCASPKEIHTIIRSHKHHMMTVDLQSTKYSYHRCSRRTTILLPIIIVCALLYNLQYCIIAAFSSSSTTSAISMQRQSHSFALYDEPSNIEMETSTTHMEQQQQQQQQLEQTSSSSKPPWMKCINAVVPPHITALNEAVSLTSNVTLSTANDLISIGAVWARMDTLSNDDILEQYYNNDNPSSANLKYADFPSGWGSGNENDELYNVGKQGNDIIVVGEDDDDSGDGNQEEDGDSLDEYIERQMSLRYRRILTPSTIDPGTDIRIYPTPRRFPSCYDLADPNRLLYEDTTFIVVDKPPMLPTQPEPSNYEECCPGCVNLLMGPFQTITGELVNRPLICHRVDSCVGGCLVLSKDGNGQKVFSDLQVKGRRMLLLFVCS